ncbi:hypothetical protein LOZ66_002082 [Ophidiomyces ophidiicola]|nr:hypothetical protein LOZ65_001562 [Ophidiomyces ophidiicola]KAI1940488.1 hypothetical protein LOZ66_002082 [Ophidiomyces ophidiicola]
MILVKTTMRPLDKQSNPPNKAFISTSAAFNRPNRAPLTPKLAGYNPPHLTHKFQHADTPSPHVTRVADNPPTPPALNANITPRSGPRNLRRDGVSSSSPLVTPPNVQHARLSQTSRPYPADSSLGLRDNNAQTPRLSRPKNIINGTPHNTPVSNPAPPGNTSLGSPMFFRAADAQSSTSSYDADNKVTHAQPNTQKFIYANGVTDVRTSSSISQNSVLAKTKVQNTGLPSTVARSPVVSPRLQNAQPLPPSPRIPVFSGRGSNRSSLQSTHAQEPTIPHASRPPPTSADARRPSHIKSPSVDGSQCFRQARPPFSSPPSYPGLLSAEQSGASSPNQSPMPSSNRSSSSGDIPQPLPRIGSPSKEDLVNNQPRPTELASNARTERKVLDLEISNSSLLAINRALEREMRKQNAELRRYRRLSRSGRLSMTSSRRSISGGMLSVVSETDGAASEESYIAPNNMISDSEDDIGSSDDENASAYDGTEKNEDERAWNENKIFADLAQHQQLLIDSQKLNHSLQRCLGRTESLILEGKKALEYKVLVSDIDIGGRVLAPDDLDAEWDGGRGLLSPSMEIPNFSEDQSFLDDAILADLPLSDNGSEPGTFNSHDIPNS